MSLALHVLAGWSNQRKWDRIPDDDGPMSVAIIEAAAKLDVSDLAATEVLDHRDGCFEAIAIKIRCLTEAFGESVGV